MNTRAGTAFGSLVLACSITAAAQVDSGQLASPPAKKAEQQFDLCTTNVKTDAAERNTLETHSSPALEEALLSSKSFWNFITDPSTPYFDRLAAANRGGSILRPEELPLLWQAMAEVDLVPTGVNPPPCSAVAGITFRPPALEALHEALQPDSHKPREQPARVVLGREVQLPTKNIDYPVTTEERDLSPWLWQMERALSILFTKTNIHYGDLSRYPLRVKAAWDWPIAVSEYRSGEVVHDFNPIEWNRIRIRSRALTERAPHDTLLLQAIVKLALNNDNYYVGYSAHVDDLYAWGQDSFRYEELAHVAQIAILQKTRWENVAAQTAFVTASLAQQKSEPTNVPHVKPLKTATAVLAIGRWAMDKSVNPWNRYYSFVQPICRMVDDAPCPSEQIRDPSDARLNQGLRDFESWFEKNKPELEHQAEAERPHLVTLAKELQTDIE